MAQQSSGISSRGTVGPGSKTTNPEAVPTTPEGELRAQVESLLEPIKVSSMRPDPERESGYGWKSKGRYKV